MMDYCDESALYGIVQACSRHDKGERETKKKANEGREVVPGRPSTSPDAPEQGKMHPLMALRQDDSPCPRWSAQKQHASRIDDVDAT